MPRYSTLIPQTARSSQLLVRPQNIATLTIAMRGITSVGSATMKLHEEIEIEQDVEDDRAKNDEHEQVLLSAMHAAREPARIADTIRKLPAACQSPSRQRRDQSGCAGAGIEPHAHMREDEFQIFEQDQARASPRSTTTARHAASRRTPGTRSASRPEADGRSPPWRAACDSPRSPRSASGCRAARPTGGSRSHCRACSASGRNRRSSARSPANSGCRRAISSALVERLAPLISRRWPRLAARSSSASMMREAPPVSTTMPSALRSSLISSVGRRVGRTRRTRAPAAGAPTAQQHDRRPADAPQQPPGGAPGRSAAVPLPGHRRWIPTVRIASNPARTSYRKFRPQ